MLYPQSVIAIHLTLFPPLLCLCLFHFSSNRAFVRVTDSLHVTGDPAGSVYGIFIVRVFPYRRRGTHDDAYFGRAPQLHTVTEETLLSVSIVQWSQLSSRDTDDASVLPAVTGDI